MKHLRTYLEKAAKIMQKGGRDGNRALWYAVAASFEAVHSKVCMGNGGRSPSSTGYIGSKWGLVGLAEDIVHISQVTEPFLPLPL